jgi:glycosyltransferase involved in cell wall biosynthesis
VHIVVFTAYYPTPEQIFSGTFVREQVGALARHHQVTVIRPIEKPVRQLFSPISGPQQDENWSVYFPHYIAPPPRRIEYIPGLSQIYAAFACSRGIDWSSVDIVHAHVPYPSGFAAVWLARYYRKPLVLTEHSGDFKRSISLSLHRRVLIHWTIRQALITMPVSKSLQRNIEREGILANFTVVPNVVNVDIFHPQESSLPRENNTFSLLWIGGATSSYIERKGGPELLQAIALARPRLKKTLRFSLVVSSVARAMCETLALRLGIFDCCEFLGTLSNLEVRNQMQQHDALVLASHSESFGVVLIEAMACGKPVIATRCGGPSEIVTPETGILIPPGDVEAMAETIVQMSETVDTYDPARIAAYTKETFGPEAVVQKLNGIYAEACALHNERKKPA